MLLASLFLFVGMVMAQMKVSGKVTSSDDGEPVVGASVKVLGTNTGTITNAEGAFTLQVEQGAMLEFSYIGMLSQKLKRKLLKRCNVDRCIAHTLVVWRSGQ